MFTINKNKENSMIVNIRDFIIISNKLSDTLKEKWDNCTPDSKNELSDEDIDTLFTLLDNMHEIALMEYDCIVERCLKDGIILPPK